MKDTAALFEATSVHDVSPDAGLRKSESVRIADTLAMIPEETESVLDVGCGPGKLLHRIPIKKAFGTDLGRVGLNMSNAPWLGHRSSSCPLPTRASTSCSVQRCLNIWIQLYCPRRRPNCIESPVNRCW